jgi:hypothetical protein
LCDIDFGHEFWTPTRRFLAGEWRLSQKRSILDTSLATRTLSADVTQRDLFRVSNSGEALCSTPLLEVAVNRRPEVLFLSLWLGLGACLEFDEVAPS